MIIRPAETADLEAATQLWFDRIHLLQQTDSHIQLLPAAEDAWRSKARSWIADDKVLFLVSAKCERLFGMIAVDVVEGRPGLHPQRRGVVLDMAVDLHETHRGASEQLLERAKNWLSAQNVTQLEIDVPARYPVEAAFWRAQGARLRFERHWLRI
jgi:GNAT superfamily N-acetyltransferase